MKITIYELLELVKDGKAPENIKYDGQTWELNYPTGDYFNGDLRIWLFQEYTQQRSLSGFLNDEVEIIEEPKKIEKIKSNGDEFYSDYIDAWISKNKTDAYCEFLMNKINEIIDEINNLKEND